MSDNENQDIDLEVIQPTAIEAQERAQVDIQIATARKWPRIISEVKRRMLSYATLDEETAAGCFYTLPPRKDKDGKMVRFQGPSVRLAEIALASYQHVKAGSRIIGDDGKFITAQAVVHDLENNVSVSIEVRRRVTTKDGRRFGDDMIATTGNAAVSFALRNAVFRVVPRALIMPVYEQAKRVAIGDVKSLVAKRAKIIERLSKYGVTVEMILNSLGVSKVDDIGLDQMEILMGHGTSLKDGEFSVEELFPDPGQTDEPKPTGPKFRKPEPAPTPPVDQPAPSAPVDTPTAPALVVTQPEPTTEQPEPTLQAQLAALVACSGGTFDDFVTLCRSQNWVKPEVLDPWTGFVDISDALAKRFLNAKRGVENGIKAILETKAGQS